MGREHRSKDRESLLDSGMCPSRFIQQAVLEMRRTVLLSERYVRWSQKTLEDHKKSLDF
ncbi:MAG: hypothetical protein AB1898_31365 [Acidobacteriota bacterium]